jgi:hypothetical protein
MCDLYLEKYKVLKKNIQKVMDIQKKKRKFVLLIKTQRI